MDENLSRGYVQLGQCRGAERNRGRFHCNAGISMPEPPQDHCNCIYIGLILAGAGFLLPYNSFIIAVDYFQGKYPGTMIVFDMCLLYILVAFAAVVLNNVLINILPLYTRITFGYILSFATLVFVVVFEIGWDAFDHQTGYKVNLAAVAVVAFGCTIQQSSFYGYTSMLPPRYTQAVMTGESAAGFIVSLNRILTKLLLRDERINTMLFFGISIGSVLICFVIYNLIERTEFVKFYRRLCTVGGIEGDLDGGADGVPNGSAHSELLLKRQCNELADDAGLAAMIDERPDRYGVLTLRSPTTSPTETYVATHRPRAFSNPVYELFNRTATAHDGGGPLLSSGMVDPTEDPDLDLNFAEGARRFRVQEVVVKIRAAQPTQICHAIKTGMTARIEVATQIWPYMLSIGVAYFVTLCLFPGIESIIVSCRLGTWMPVIMMAIFNASDFVGKILASIPYDWSRTQLLTFSSMRFILIPMLAFCALPGRHSTTVDDVWAMILSAILGVTNGVFGSVPMIVAPSRVMDEHKELAGNIMMLSYSIGLTTGSLVAYLILEIITKSQWSQSCHDASINVTTTALPTQTTTTEKVISFLYNASGGSVSNS